MSVSYRCKSLYFGNALLVVIQKQRSLRTPNLCWARFALPNLLEKHFLTVGWAKARKRRAQQKTGFLDEHYLVIVIVVIVIILITVVVTPFITR